MLLERNAGSEPSWVLFIYIFIFYSLIIFDFRYPSRHCMICYDRKINAFVLSMWTHCCLHCACSFHTREHAKMSNVQETHTRDETHFHQAILWRNVNQACNVSPVRNVSQVRTLMCITECMYTCIQNVQIEISKVPVDVKL